MEDIPKDHKYSHDITDENDPSPPSPKKEILSQEEISLKIKCVENLKDNANQEYKLKNYIEALNIYNQAIGNLIKDYSEEMPIHYISTIKNSIEVEFHSILSTLFLNKGLCQKQLKDVSNAVETFSKSLIFNQDNSKAVYHRLDLNYKRGEYLEAQEDYTKLKSTSSKLLEELNINEYILNMKAEQKKKEMTGEMLGKLKEVGNSFLGLFGMSVDNFQFNQGEGGGYNIQYKNK